MREHDLWPALRRYWHPVAYVEDVEEKPLAFRLLDERLAICRIGGRLAAFRDLCIHRGTPMSLGWVEGDMLVCAYHGWAYGADGACVRIPSLPPRQAIPRKACLTAYPAQQRYGMVWVCMADTPAAPIPEFPALEDPRYSIAVRDRRAWKASAARAMENFIDLAHFPWVHEGILGDRQHPGVPDLVAERHGEELRFGYERLPDALHPVAFRCSYRLFRPFAISLEKTEASTGRSEVLAFICTPNSATDTTRFFLATRNYVPDPSGEKAQEEIYPIVTEQDRTIVENQRPEELPLDLAEELHLKGADAVSLAYRRFLRELGVA